MVEKLKLQQIKIMAEEKAKAEALINKSAIENEKHQAKIIALQAQQKLYEKTIEHEKLKQESEQIRKKQ